jgi:hypothetical protein
VTFSVAVLLSSPIRCARVDEELGETLMVAGSVYETCGSEWIGFYDWLRSSEGTLLGVRSWLAPQDVVHLRAVAGSNPCLELGAKQDLKIWLSRNHEHDEWMSADQSLGTHRLMRSGNGSYALVYGIKASMERELFALCPTE